MKRKNRGIIGAAVISCLLSSSAFATGSLVKMDPWTAFEYSGTEGVTVKRLGRSDWYRVEGFTSDRSGSGLSTLALGSGVEAIEPDRLIHVDSLAPNDPSFSGQWGLDRIQYQSVYPGVLDMEPVTVAVIDTGIDRTHPDLSGQFAENPGEVGVDSSGNDKSKNGIDDDGNGYIDDVYGYDFVDSDNDPSDAGFYHGTAVAGVIAAKTNNGVGITGVAPNARLMSVRFLDKNGSGTVSAGVDAILYAVDNHAQILNLSWGSSIQSQALEEALKYARDNGVIVVAAAGNDPYVISYPAGYEMDSLVSVSATDESDELAKYSFANSEGEIAAPGNNILTTTKMGGYGAMSGTSLATPHVAGAMALYLGLASKTGLDPYRPVEALIQSARRVPGLAGRLKSEGILDLSGLLQAP